jgi:hypothetical protein
MIPNIAPLEHIAPLHVEPLHVDAGSATGDDRPLAAATPDTQSLGFTTLLDSLGAGSAALGKAEAAENAFVAGTGGLQDSLLRARQGRLDRIDRRCCLVTRYTIAQHHRRNATLSPINGGR